MQTAPLYPVIPQIALNNHDFIKIFKADALNASLDSPFLSVNLLEML